MHSFIDFVTAKSSIQPGDRLSIEMGDVVVEATITEVTDESVTIFVDVEGEKILSEAEYQGQEVPLNKPMAGDVKKSKVFVKNAQGNVVKVNFGDKNLSIKKHIPARRKSFRARHNCANPGPKTKARYWSCKAW